MLVQAATILNPRAPAYPLLLAGAAVCLNSLPAAVHGGLAALALLVVGIPHGALDHVVAAATAAREAAAGILPKGSTGTSGHHPVRFYAWYIALAVLYCVVWALMPTAAAVAFALLTSQHFGETDLEALSIDGTEAAPPARDSRGGAAVSLFMRAIALLHMCAYGAAVTLSLAVPFPVAANGGPAAAVAAVQATWPPLLWLGAAVHALPPHASTAVAVVLSHPHVVDALQPALSVGGTGAASPLRYARWAGFALFLVAIALVGARTGPALPFALYFGAWHSMQALAHVRKLVPQATLDAQDWWRWATLAGSPISSATRDMSASGDAGEPATSPEPASHAPLRASIRLRASPRSGNGSGPGAVPAPARATPLRAHERTRGRTAAAAPHAASPARELAAVSGTASDGTAPASPLQLWLNALPLSVAALFFLPPLAFALPASAVAASGVSGSHAPAPDAVGSPVPPLILVLLAVLTLPHAQIMHASYAAARTGAAEGQARSPSRARAKS